MTRLTARQQWRRVAAVPVASTLVASIALLLASSNATATAHTGLKRSDPAKGSRLSAAPARIALWFTARPQLPFARIRLAGPSGDVALDRIVADTGNGFYANVTGAVAPGDYTVHWQTASADGHPIRGELSFTVLGTGPTVATSVVPAQGTTQTTQAKPLVVHSEYRTARWIEFVALLTVLGALGFRHGVLPPLAARGVPTADAADRARRLGQSVLIVYAVAAVVRLYTESVAMAGEGAPLESDTILALITGTTWGIGWLAGILGALLVLVGWTISKKTVTVGTPLALTGAFAMVLSPAMSGHASASRHFILSMTLDMLHVAAAGAWLGGLLLVMIAGIPAMRRLTDGNTDAAISALVSSFHPIALFCAPLVVIAGLGTSWIRLGSLSNLVATDYGRNLLFKVGVVVLVAGMGAYNALRARRRLGAAEGTRHFKRTATLELVFAAVVLAITTALVATPVPSDLPTP
jgi:copper transport protein